MNFTEKMTELNNILKNLEENNMSLEASLEEFERGVKLIKECQTYLNEAKQKITVLTEDGETEYTK